METNYQPSTRLDIAKEAYGLRELPPDRIYFVPQAGLPIMHERSSPERVRDTFKLHAERALPRE